MISPNLAQFAKQRYLNLETYRKNGQPVRTPMWFAEADGILYMYSLAGAGKVKRIRNNPRVRVVPCGFRGRPHGTWVRGIARIVDEADARQGHQLLNQKYGLWKRGGDFFGRLRRRQHVVITIRID